MRKIFIFLIILSFLSWCQSAKDALTMKKKKSGDEFLVEKKSPLVLPPNYGELPTPIDENLKEVEKNSTLGISLGNDELKIDNIIKNSNPSALEKSVLKKIK